MVIESDTVQDVSAKVHVQFVASGGRQGEVTDMRKVLHWTSIYDASKSLALVTPREPADFPQVGVP